MKYNNFWSGLLSLLLVLGILCTAGAVTAFAAPEDEQEIEQIVAGDTPQEEQQEQAQQPEAAQEQQSGEQAQEQAQPQEQVQEQQEQQEQQNEWYDYIYSYDEDADSSYVAPEHLGDLPAVSSGQVVEATAVAMPAVAVSDASLFSGIVMWLCVALGIAVIVGVLVSKRTRRRGA